MRPSENAPSATCSPCPPLEAYFPGIITQYGVEAELRRLCILVLASNTTRYVRERQPAGSFGPVIGGDDMARSKASGGGEYRSAISGRYVTAAHGRRSPRTTVREQGPQFLSCPYPANSLRHQGWWRSSQREKRPAPLVPEPTLLLAPERYHPALGMPRLSQTANR